MTAQEILKLIETVDTADTAKLDEIDARVWWFINPHGNGIPPGWERQWHPYYTRSLDALKAIEPRNMIANLYCPNASSFIFQLMIRERGFCKEFISPGTTNDKPKPLSTEHLARLHAIIQAIEYDRQNGDKDE